MNPELPLSNIGDKASHVMWVFKASVFPVISEYKKCGELNSPKKTKSCKCVLDEIDDFDKNTIKINVHEFFFRNELQTIRITFYIFTKRTGQHSF